MKFHSPYQFIRVDTSHTETTHWNQHDDLAAESNAYVRHDFWHPEGESGRITCLITCESPLVVGGKQEPGDKSTPGRVEPYRHPDGTLAIPGNSLRGMIAGLAETLSQSALRVITSQKESTYSVRKEAKSTQNMELGLLYKKGERFRICPLPSPIPVGHYGREDRDTRFILSEKSYQRKHYSRFVWRNRRGLSANADKGGEKGVLYIRVPDEKSRKKMPDKKRHETFIPWNEEKIKRKIEQAEGYEVPASLIQTTENILRMRHKADEEFPQLPKGYKRDWENEQAPIIQDGDLIYFRKKGEAIEGLSYSAIWRKPVEGKSLHEAFARSGGKNSLPWHKERKALTPAEALFGVVEDEPEKDKPARNIASRVRFTDATPEGSIEPGSEITLKVLASPKPPSPSMYFRRPAGGYVSKRDLNLDRDIPNGRKHYLPHPAGSNIWETQIANTPDHNWKPHLKCSPIPAESRFTFQIHYENLSRAELGLLRTALEPGDGYIHRLGLGKPLGLGQITLEVTNIERIDRAERYRRRSLTEPRYQPLTEAIDTRLIDRHVLETLRTLGNPANLRYPVSYPYTMSEDQSRHLEKKGFQWFMENEALDSGQQYLRPIEPGAQLPNLESSHPRLTIPLNLWERNRPDSREIKAALQTLGPEITINAISQKGGNSTVYLGDNSDIGRLANALGEIVITLRGRAVTCTPLPQITETSE